MAIIKSAKKASRRSIVLRERNLVFKLAMKKSIKTFKKALDIGESKKKLEELLSVAYSSIDKCKRRNILHKKTASRKKSRLAIKIEA